MKDNLKKIAFCITCMNRLHHLQQTLEKNILDNYLLGDVEFVLLDYNSQDGLEEWVQQNMQSHINSGILFYYKTFEPEYYFRNPSRNLAFRLANAEIVCNLDADNFLGKGFASFMIHEFSVNENIFFTSDSRNNDTYGRICVRQKDLLSVKGYNENLQGYGQGDLDLFVRLEKSGLIRKYFNNPDFYHCIFHSKAERVTNEQMTKNTKQMYISYINPYSSDILLLYKDHTYLQCTLIDTPHLYYLPNFIPPDNYREKIVTLKDGFQKGNWQEKNSEKSEIFYQNKKYYLIQDEELVLEIIILLTTAINHFLIQQQLKENRPVNPDGFGKGVVYKNFDMENKIILL